ncbi:MULTISPECIES: OsmC family protein [Priestia]|uniref:OsmC family protein n=1 Tax=Priestia TaxID=2800373 RepID=UPI00203D4644|nr:MULTISPECIES: OsmC family protein [Priestia]MCM3770755.1 OsmC family protein [Priestia aryabhattai]MDY0941127.1 OsmC family protein [Priestia megaterium]
MAKHHFHLQANWPGGRNEVGTIESGQLKTKISIPPEMDGPGAGTNPDEMLLGAAATCYIITLAAMLERSGIHQEALTMESEAIVDVTNGVFTYEKIIHKPHVIVTSDLAAQEEKINRLIKKAETSCMISRAIQGNVEIELEPQLTVKA